MRIIAVCVLLSSAACTQFPELDAWQSTASNAAYPTLLPIDQLLGPEAVITQPEVRGAIESRVSRLRQRAAALRSDVITPSNKRRMLRSVAANS